MFRIDKQFSLCYGHRVHTQLLDADYTEKGKTLCKCRFLHGHEGLVHVFLQASDLRDGMVVDFNHLGWLKDFIDTHLDHKFIIDANDPNFSLIVGDKFPQLITNPVDVAGVFAGSYFTTDMEYFTEKEMEHFKSFFIVNFVPTSENLAHWMFNLVQAKMEPLGVTVAGIDWWETPKSRAAYVAV